MTKSILQGKHILLFCPKTFGYETAISEELRAIGAKVTYHGDKPREGPFTKALFRIFPKIGWHYSDIYFKSWITENCPDKYDFIFIIKGEGISPKTLKVLKINFPKAVFLLYLWDSINNVRYTELKLPYVQEYITFDPNDCNYIKNSRYRPLFFLKNYAKSQALTTEKTPARKSVFFIGTLNGDRPEVVYRFLTALKSDIEFDYWFFVRNRIELKLRMIFDRYVRKFDNSRLLFNSLSSDKISQHMHKCVAVLDIEHPGQSGLTMRTFEVLASGKKLITTNITIKTHNFYSPERICIIDRKNPSIPSGFFESIAAPLPQNFFSEYSLNGWLLDIFKNHVPERVPQPWPTLPETGKPK